MNAAKYQSLDDMMAEDEAARIEQTRRDLEIENLPENVAKRAAKRQEEFDRGVRLGWHDKDGNPINQETDDEDDEETDTDDTTDDDTIDD